MSTCARASLMRWASMSLRARARWLALRLPARIFFSGSVQPGTSSSSTRTRAVVTLLLIEDLVDGHLVAQSLERHAAERGDPEVVLHQLVGRLTDDDLAGIGRGL